jgi:hypothetical protein
MKKRNLAKIIFGGMVAKILLFTPLDAGCPDKVNYNTIQQQNLKKSEYIDNYEKRNLFPANDATYYSKPF